MERAGFIVLCLVLAVGCYYLLPVVTHDTAGFTLNAFDLAEWSSLHPSVRSSSPPMLTSFLLRLPLVCLSVGLALAANGLLDLRFRWFIRVLALAMLLRLIPPTDFFSGASADSNYRQMALLFGLGMVLVGVTLLMSRIRWHQWILAALLIIGVIAGWVGLSRSLVLLRDFQIDYQTGSGLIGLSLFVAAAVATIVWSAFKPRQLASPAVSA